MNKLVIVIVVAVAIIGSISISFFPSPEDENLSVERMHGNVSTTMGSPIMGDPSAPITIVEFGDYQCHQCFNWFHQTKPSLTSEYIDTGKVNFVFVDFAFLGQDSAPAAQATYCAEDQGRYWDYHDILYNSQESQIDNGWANKERLKAFAFSMGFDMELFDSCLDSGKYVKRVQYNIEQARDQKVNGTPTFVIVGPDGQQEKIVGAQPYRVFKQIVDSMI